MPKLTETFAKRQPQAPQGTTKYWDSEVRGFCLFVGKQAKTWYYQRDVGGRTRRVLIGRFPTISAAAAREAALTLSLEMGREAGKTFQSGAPRLQDAMESYLARPKLRSEVWKQEVRGFFERHMRDWLRLHLDEISRAMVVARHAELARTPSSANHALRVFRTVYNHARRTHQLPEAPTLAIEWYPEEPDGRTIDNLPEWRRTVDMLDNPIHTAFYRLLLFTGFRKSETRSLRWRDVHADRIVLPITKNGRAFELPIVEVHREILEPMRGLSREWVFPSPKAASSHVETPQRLAWSPHAHRRTFATVGVEAGVLEEIVGRLLNHTPTSVTGNRYVKPSLDALRPQMQVISDELVHRISNPAQQRGGGRSADLAVQ